MRFKISAKCTGVTREVDGAVKNLNISRSDGDVVARRDEVLRADVDVAEEEGRQARDEIVGVRDAEVAAGLVADVGAEVAAADSGGAVGVLMNTISKDFQIKAGRLRTYQCNIEPYIPKVGCGEASDGAAQTVSSDGDLEAGVGGGSGRDGGNDTGPGLEPGGVEAFEAAAVCADIRGDESKVDVGQEVPDGLSASEGNDDEAVGYIRGDIARDIGEKGTEIKVSVELSSHWIVMEDKGNMVDHDFRKPAASFSFFSLEGQCIEKRHIKTQQLANTRHKRTS